MAGLPEEIIEKIVGRKNLYSREETKIGIWRDVNGNERTIYRKVVVTEEEGTSFAILHNISNLDFFTKIEGTIKPSFSLPFGFANISANAQVAVFCDATKINFRISEAYSKSTKIVILEYLKTLDK